MPQRRALRRALPDAHVERLRERYPELVHGDAGRRRRACCATSSICSAAAVTCRSIPIARPMQTAISRSTGTSIRCRGLRFPRGVPLADVELRADAARARRHQAAVGAGAVPALAAARPGVPADRRRSLRAGDRPRAARLHGGQPDRHRRQLDLHDGRGDARGQLGARARVDPVVREPAAEFWREAYEALFDHGAFIERNLENTLRGDQQSLPEQRRRPVLPGGRVSTICPAGPAWDRQCRDVARAGNGRAGAARRRRLRVVRSVSPAGQRAVPRRRARLAETQARRCPDSATASATWSSFSPRCSGPTA